VGLIILVIALFAFLLYFLNKKFEVFYDLVKEMEEVKPIVKSLNRKMDQNNSKGYLSVIRPQTRCQLNLIGFNFFMLEPMQIMLISFESSR